MDIWSCGKTCVLPPRLIGLLWGTGDVNIEDDPELAAFKSDPLRNGILQVVDQGGKVLEVEKLERPLAKLQVTQLMETPG